MEVSTLLVDSLPTQSGLTDQKLARPFHRAMRNLRTMEGRGRIHQVPGALDTLPVAWPQREGSASKGEDAFALIGTV